MTDYNRAWFFRRRVGRYEVQQHVMAVALYRLWRPRRVFDLGCGIASYLAAFEVLGCEIGGCDLGWESAREFTRANVRPHCFRADAGGPLKVGKGYDLVLCIEVAEHIPAEQHPVFFDNLRRLSRGCIVFTGGEPGQPGYGHVSCMPREAWIETLGKHGLAYQSQETQDLAAALDAIGDPVKLRRRAMVLRRATDA